jgi:hypothetical protein
MPGGLMQLVGVGAQNQLTTGNPTFTFFKAMYRKHTNFAMEHFTLTFRGTDLNLPTENQKTLRCKFDRNSDMLHDIYLLVNLPNIWSPLHVLPGVPPSSLEGNARPFLFQWIDNIGYNLIESVSLLINGSKIVTFTGEWLKFYSYLTHDKNKKEIVDQMVGNIPELYDPANAGGRTNNYPNAIQGTDLSLLPQPSIPGRQLVIPLHFWFCEQVGKALPLIALQYSEVEVSVTFRNIYQLYTIMDVDPTSQTYGQRIAPNAGNSLQNISNFLSPPLIDGTPTNPDLVNWAANPLIEANYIFLSEPERREVAASDHGFMIPEVRLTSGEGLVGDTVSPLNMFNLCTRVVFAYQRSDRLLANDWDNYTNWEDPALQPLLLVGGNTSTVLNSSGVQLPDSVTDRNILRQAYIEFDGKERFKEKPTSFFDLIQHYRHHTGSTSKLPGLYAYSFALDHATTQPSGSANGSMFNKTHLRAKLQVPANLVPNINACGVPTTVEKTEVCVYKDTVFNPNPTPAPVTTQQDKVLAIYRINSTGQNYPYPYTYSGRFYVESYNYLRIMSGTANVAFSS